MYCTKCGAQQDDNAAYCSTCNGNLKPAITDNKGVVLNSDSTVFTLYFLPIITAISSTALIILLLTKFISMPMADKAVEIFSSLFNYASGLDILNLTSAGSFSLYGINSFLASIGGNPWIALSGAFFIYSLICIFLLVHYLYGLLWEKELSYKSSIPYFTAITVLCILIWVTIFIANKSVDNQLGNISLIIGNFLQLNWMFYLMFFISLGTLIICLIPTIKKALTKSV